MGLNGKNENLEHSAQENAWCWRTVINAVYESLFWKMEELLCDFCFLLHLGNNRFFPLSWIAIEVYFLYIKSIGGYEMLLEISH